MTLIIDGKALANKKLEKLKAEIHLLDKSPSLAIILVGSNETSQIYVKNKILAANKIGIKAVVIELESSITTNMLNDKISELNEEPEIDGIIVQLPLPEQIKSFDIISKIDPKKDVDGFHPYNIGMLYSGQDPYFVSCTPRGILELIKEYYVEISGFHAVIVGRSNIVGKPLASLLLKNDMTVTICHSKTKNLADITKNADIVILASGNQLSFGKEYFSDKSIVIDVGISKTPEGRTVGDANFDEVEGFVSAITRVPGGVGPMTVACLMENVVIAHKKKYK